MGWLPPTPLIFAIAHAPARRCWYCTGGWWGGSHCCRRGLATEDYGARLMSSLPSSNDTEKKT